MRLAAALSVLPVIGALAHGFEYAPVPGVPASEKPGRRLDFLVGLGVGTSTNVTRASASTESDTVYEILAGVELVGNYTRSKYILAVETRYEGYARLGEYSYQEYSVGGGFLWGTKKANLGLDARFASLTDPVEAEFLTDLLERRAVSFIPRLGFTPGKLEVEVAYNLETLQFDDDAYSRLDHSDTRLETELRFWTRPQASQFFLHYDSGTVHYALPSTDRKDFNYTRAYGGLRAGSPRKAHYEIGAGVYTVGGEDVSSAVGATFSLRSTIVRDQGNSKFEMTYSISPEPAATADYKEAQRIQAAFVRQVNARWRWSFALRSEISAFKEPDTGESATLSFQVLEAGLQRDLGSPGRWHGRFYFTLNTEFGQDFDRFRAFIGAGLAH